MIRRAVWAAVILLATLATPVAVLAGPTAANAAGLHLCEAYGNHYCVGADNINLYTHLTETKPGRNITAARIDQETYHGLPIYYLTFDLDPTRCVASTNGGVLVDVRPCGNTGTVWARDTPSSGNDLWINRYATDTFGGGTHFQYLTGNNDGTVYYLNPRPGPTGSNQQFNLTG